jgi:PhnB protein
MTTPIPPLTPYLAVKDAAAAIEFYKKAFGAIQDGEPHYLPNTQMIMHVRLLINGSLIMLADDMGPTMGKPAIDPLSLGNSPITLALSFDDVTPFWERAVAAGITVTMPLADMFWGDRYGQATDPFGHKWSFSQTLQQMSDQEMQDAAESALEDKGTLMGEPIKA